MSTRTGTKTVVGYDAENEVILIKRVDPTAGTDIVGAPTITIALGDLEGLGPMNADLALRWFYFQDVNSSCAPMKMVVLATAPESAA